MRIEKSQEYLASGPKGLKESAANAIKNIQSLKNSVSIDEAFPRMAELMNTADGHKTFRAISDMTQVCQWQNAAVDRRATQQYCEVMDPEESSSLV